MYGLKYAIFLHNMIGRAGDGEHGEQEMIEEDAGAR